MRSTIWRTLAFVWLGASILGGCGSASEPEPTGPETGGGSGKTPSSSTQSTSSSTFTCTINSRTYECPSDEAWKQCATKGNTSGCSRK